MDKKLVFNDFRKNLSNSFNCISFLPILLQMPPCDSCCLINDALLSYKWYQGFSIYILGSYYFEIETAKNYL